MTVHSKTTVIFSCPKPRASQSHTDDDRLLINTLPLSSSNGKKSKLNQAHKHWNQYKLCTVRMELKDTHYNSKMWFHRQGQSLARDTDLACTGTPQIDRGSQAHAEHVLWGPVHKVKVKVILQLRGIQHFERNLGNLAHSLLRTNGNKQRLVRLWFWQVCLSMKLAKLNINEQ